VHVLFMQFRSSHSFASVLEFLSIVVVHSCGKGICCVGLDDTIEMSVRKYKQNHLANEPYRLSLLPLAQQVYRYYVPQNPLILFCSCVFA
jgi:hypothetical protein